MSGWSVIPIGARSPSVSGSKLLMVREDRPYPRLTDVAVEMTVRRSLRKAGMAIADTETYRRPEAGVDFSKVARMSVSSFRLLESPFICSSTLPICIRSFDFNSSHGWKACR